jgi:hypothetical protein
MAVAKRRQIGGQRTEFEEEASSKGSAGILPAVSRILRDTSSEVEDLPPRRKGRKGEELLVICDWLLGVMRKSHLPSSLMTADY